MSRRAAINTGLSVVGVALLIWQVQDAGGLAAVRRGLASVGTGFAVVLILSFLRFLMRAIAWRALLGEPAPLTAALAATISGDALGNITPFGLAASEPAKAFYLGRHLDPQRAFAALAAENFFYSVSVAIYVMLGTAMLLYAYPVDSTVRVAGLALLGAMTGVLIVAAWLAWRKPAVASAVVSRLKIRSLTELASTVRSFEHTAYRATGKLMEKYDAENPALVTGGGEYLTQDGFGWTNGVLRKLLALYPDAVAPRPGVSWCESSPANDNVPAAGSEAGRAPAVAR